MLGKMTVIMEPGNAENASAIACGPLLLPDFVNVDGGHLIAFGEDDQYLHCVISGTGRYIGVFKSNDKNHLYQHILRHNT